MCISLFSLKKTLQTSIITVIAIKKPITLAVTPSHILYHKLYKNTSTLTTHNQQNVYFISRSENIQFGHGSTQGTLRGREIEDSVTLEDGLRCVRIKLLRHTEFIVLY